MGVKRHIVDVMRPTKNSGTLGETQGQPEVVIKNWPCSIVTLSGSEAESARQNTSGATLEVRGYGDPNNPIDEDCFLKFGNRNLTIVAINDEDQNGIKLRLMCGETK